MTKTFNKNLKVRTENQTIKTLKISQTSIMEVTEGFVLNEGCSEHNLKISYCLLHITYKDTERSKALAGFISPFKALLRCVLKVSMKYSNSCLFSFYTHLPDLYTQGTIGTHFSADH